jgi:hypothetical protein
MKILVSITAHRTSWIPAGLSAILIIFCKKLVPGVPQLCEKSLSVGIAILKNLVEQSNAGTAGFRFSGAFPILPFAICAVFHLVLAIAALGRLLFARAYKVSVIH